MTDEHVKLLNTLNLIVPEPFNHELILMIAEYELKSRALDIIVNKNVEMWLLKDSVNLEQYNYRIHIGCGKLTQEEFVILNYKEIMKGRLNNAS